MNWSLKGTPGFIAPEILLKQPYQGSVADLFSCAVILFYLHSGHLPFYLANFEDPFYDLLCSNKSHLFWEVHGNTKPNNWYSEDFKDLITMMLQFNPQHRLVMADVIGHTWMQGDLPSQQEVKAELLQRQGKVLSPQKLEPRQVNTKTKAIRKKKHDVHLGLELEADDSQINLLPKKEPADYTPGQNKNITSFILVAPAEKVFVQV